MAKKKYYAVKVGEVPGIYENWSDCKSQIDGFSGAIYKSFATRKEAEQFIGSVPSLLVEKEENDDFNIDNYISKIDSETLVAFVDGSYDATSKIYGYGAVLISKNNPIETISGSDNNKDYVETRNVAGEIEGVQNAITYAVGEGYKKIVLFHDYIGIRSWALGEWKANAAISRDYVLFIDQMKRCIEIDFQKVKAHSGVTYNEMADSLAKKSLLKKGIKSNQNGCVTVTGIDMDDFESIFELLKLSNKEIKVVDGGKLSHCENFILTLNGDKIVVSCYKKGTTTIQGKQSKLLEEFMRLLVELLPDKGEVVELLNDYHEITMDKDKITNRFNHLLPNFERTKTDDQKLINTLNQAVYNTLLTGERPDYTDLATPSLRVIEYYLYNILVSKGITTVEDNKHGFGYFDKIENVFYLQETHKAGFSSQEVEYLNELYNFYYNHRHTLDHWNKNGLTRMLKTMEEARQLIVDNLELINKFYITF